MITQEEFQKEEAVKRWNIFFVFLFIFLAFLFLLTFDRRGIFVFQNITLLEIAILTLAVARMIRLISYDNIALFVREAFLDVKRVRQVEGGIEHYERVESENAFKRTVSKLLNCPWCLGVWVTLIFVWLFREFPLMYFLFVILAISQLASFVQILANLFGWSAEQKKIQTEKIS